MSWVSKAFKKVESGFKHVINLPSEIGDKMQDLADNISGKKAAERANDAAMQAWNMQNDYNSPANQVQRLRDAGLNPNLFYNMGDTGNASSAPDITHSYDKMKFLDLAMNALKLKTMIGQWDAQKLANEHSRLVNNSIKKYGMGPNMFTGFLNMLDRAGYNPQEAFKRTVDMVAGFAGGVGNFFGNAVGGETVVKEYGPDELGPEATKEMYQLGYSWDHNHWTRVRPEGRNYIK